MGTLKIVVYGGIFVWLGLSGCAVNPDRTPTNAERLDTLRRDRMASFEADSAWVKGSENDLAPALAAYAADRGCEGETFSLAKGKIEYYSKDRTSYYSPVGDPTDRLMLSLIDGAHMNAARSLVNLGDQAARKHCYTVARRTYSDVIAVFVGSNYAAYRQKAQIGIEEIHGLKGRT